MGRQSEVAVSMVMDWYRCGTLRGAKLYDVVDDGGERNLKGCIASADGKVSIVMGPKERVIF